MRAEPIFSAYGWNWYDAGERVVLVGNRTYEYWSWEEYEAMLDELKNQGRLP